MDHTENVSSRGTFSPTTLCGSNVTDLLPDTRARQCAKCILVPIRTSHPDPCQRISWRGPTERAESDRSEPVSAVEAD